MADKRFDTNEELESLGIKVNSWADHIVMHKTFNINY